MTWAVKTKRLIRSFAIVCALVAAVPVSGAITQMLHGDIQAVAAREGIDAGSIVQGVDPEVALGRLEDVAMASTGGLPQYFLDEIGLQNGASDVRVDEGGQVVGYVVEGDASDVLANLQVHMQQRGWSAVSLGELDGATFVKQGGECSWALATCTQIGSSTSVVFRCVIS